jgi:hypothetical protein
MRVNFRIKLGGNTFFMMFARTQTLEGITSLMPNGKHIILWDIEDCTLEQAKHTLQFVQLNYDLSDIYVTSDKNGSYRAWCFNRVSLKQYIHILLDTDFLDYGFMYYTVKRKKATLRTSKKQGRVPQRIVSILRSYPVPIPEQFEKVIYDTGIDKRGTFIRLGDKEALDDDKTCGDQDFLGRRES